MIVYKLTDRLGYTRRGMYNEILWGVGIKKSLPKATPYLCTSTVIHAYRSAETALLCNSFHANIVEPRLWECQTSGIVDSDSLKIGVYDLEVISELEIPRWTDHIHRVGIRFLLNCMKKNREDYAAAYDKPMLTDMIELVEEIISRDNYYNILADEIELIYKITCYKVSNARRAIFNMNFGRWRMKVDDYGNHLLDYSLYRLIDGAKTIVLDDDVEDLIQKSVAEEIEYTNKNQRNNLPALISGGIY